jgi:hypothetical protein
MPSHLIGNRLCDTLDHAGFRGAVANRTGKSHQRN